MTPFVKLTVAPGLFTGAWLTRQRWLSAAAQAAAGARASLHAQRPLAMAAVLVLFVVLGPALSYLLVDAPASSPAPADALAAKAAQPLSHDATEPFASTPREPGGEAVAATEARVSTLVDQLAEIVGKRPNDADGWQTLGRAYATLGRHAQAIGAFKTAARLRPNDATLLAEYAFSAAVTDPHGASGEAAQLVERALQIDPRNAKALALAGTLAVDRKDYAGAVRHWEQLAQLEAPGSPTAREVQTSIEQARRLAAAQPGAMPVAVTALGSPGLFSPRAQVSGTVTLAPALRASVTPEDTVLVYARSPNGPRMPLAVLRKQVKDLPLRFTLDDQLSTSPGAKLSNAAVVVVGARIARSGGTMARDGDLQGQLASVPIGRGDVRIEINEVVRIR